MKKTRIYRHTTRQVGGWSRCLVQSPPQVCDPRAWRAANPTRCSPALGSCTGKTSPVYSRSQREPGEVEASPEKTLTPLHTLWDPGQKQRSLGQTDLPADLAVFPKRQEAPWGQTLVHPFPGACSILGALVNTSLEFSRWPSSLQAHLRPDISPGTHSPKTGCLQDPLGFQLTLAMALLTRRPRIWPHTPAHRHQTLGLASSTSQKPQPCSLQTPPPSTLIPALGPLGPWKQT